MRGQWDILANRGKSKMKKKTKRYFSEVTQLSAILPQDHSPE